MPPLAPALRRRLARAATLGARRGAARSGRLLASAGLVVVVAAGSGSGYDVVSSDSGAPASTADAVPNAWAAGLARAPVNSWAVELASAPENFWAKQLLTLLVIGPEAASAPSASPAGLTPEQIAIVVDPRVAASGIPARVLEAYRAAAATLATERPSCRMRWEMIAAIGRVESGHGTFRGAVVGADGRIAPEIIGLRLDGAGPVAEIRDTDGGRLDRDAEFDRAVGPMQFIPGTWARHGADGDGNGTVDPHDIDDAALGTGRYLCASGSVATSEGKVRAVYSYNHSYDYVRLVLTVAASYAGTSPESFGTGLLPAATPVDPAVVPPPVAPPVPGPRPAP
ncbi:MAG: murein transglycosylase, partial [Frankiales bacterium]|nr:murein transglycosylase [Frankiales bacterium]